jgi:hypothetical protein
METATLQEGIMGRASFLDTLKTVLSGFIGVRRKAAHEQSRISPVHVIIAAVALVVVFIFTLVTIVSIVTR